MPPTALAIGLGLGLVLLAWPVWFALKGPASLSGLVWPNVGVIGGFIPSSFVTTGYPPRIQRLPGARRLRGRAARLRRLSRVELPRRHGGGARGLLAGPPALVLRVRSVVVCAACSLGERHGQWEPAWVFTRIPVVENVIEQRFMAVGFLAAAVILAVILERVHRAATRLARRARLAGALAVAAVALVPMGIIFGDRLPFAMQAVTLPRWYSEVAPTLPPGRVLLSYPAPFSGPAVAMAWQAVNRMHYSQAGGGGPQGVPARAGSAKAGFELLSLLDFGVGLSEPAGTPAQYAAVRHALSVWQVNTVVIATDPAAPRVEQGHDPVYAAAFMTAALGRQPTLEAGAWVWNNVQLRRYPAPGPAGGHAGHLHRGGRSRQRGSSVPPCRWRSASAGVRFRLREGGWNTQASAGNGRRRGVGHAGVRLPAAGSTDRAVPAVPARAEGSEKDGAGVTTWGVRGLLGAACLVLSCAGLPALAPSPAGGATVARADGSGGARVAFPLPAGLSASEHAALERSGAYGAHPVRLLVLGDSIAMTLGMGLSVNARQQYGVSVTDDATDRVRSRPATAGGHLGGRSGRPRRGATTGAACGRSSSPGSGPRWSPWDSGAGRSPITCWTGTGCTSGSRPGTTT